jgi:hypothetical protein
LKRKRTLGIDFVLTARGNNWSLNGNGKKDEMISIKMEHQIG